VEDILARASKQRAALVGLGMTVTPHARGLRDLSHRVEVVHAYSPTAAQREAFGRNFDFPLTEACEGPDICQSIAISARRIAKNMATI
jgi:predicted dehydrogenase